MAVARRAGSQQSTFAAALTGKTLTAPTTIVNDDILVISMLIYNSAKASIPTPTPPSGFAAFTTSPALPQFLDNDTGGDGAKTYLWWKKAASESGSYATTWTNTANTSAAGWIAAYSGADTTNPVTVTGTSAAVVANTASGTPWSVTGVTTTVDGSMVIFAGWDWGTNANAYTAPAQTPPTFAVAIGTTGTNMAVFDGVVTTAGATGTPLTAANESVASDPNAVAVVVINAPSGTGPDLNVNLIN